MTGSAPRSSFESKQSYFDRVKKEDEILRRQQAERDREADQKMRDATVRAEAEKLRKLLIAPPASTMKSGLSRGGYVSGDPAVPSGQPIYWMTPAQEAQYREEQRQRLMDMLNISTSVDDLESKTKAELVALLRARYDPPKSPPPPIMDQIIKAVRKHPDPVRAAREWLMSVTTEMSKIIAEFEDDADG
jgi:hypothetical protein